MHFHAYVVCILIWNKRVGMNISGELNFFLGTRLWSNQNQRYKHFGRERVKGASLLNAQSNWWKRLCVSIYALHVCFFIKLFSALSPWERSINSLLLYTGLAGRLVGAIKRLFFFAFLLRRVNYIAVPIILRYWSVWSRNSIDNILFCLCMHAQTLS